MKKVLLLSLIFFYSIVNAQIPDSLWSRVEVTSSWYGSEANSAQLANGNAVVGMGKNSIAILDQNGTALWDTTLNNEFDEIRNIVAYGDVYYLVGESYGASSAGKIYRHDMSSSTTTIKSYVGFYEITDLVLVNGHYYATATANTTKPYLLKLNGAMDTIFTKSMHISSWNKATDIDYADGKLVMAGFWDDYPAIWKYDTVGTQLWVYDSAQFISLDHAEIIPTVNGYTYIGGNLLIQIDDMGNYLSDVFYGNHTFYGILALKNTTLLYGYYKEVDTSLRTYYHPEVVAVDNNYKITDSIWYDLRPANKYKSTFRGGNAHVNDAVLLNGWHGHPDGEEAITLYLEGDSTVGLDEINREVTFKLFPNPTSSVFNIVSEVDMDYIAIYDGRGRFMRNHQFLFERSASIDLSDLLDGFYIIQLVDRNGRRSSAILLKY